MNCQYTQIGRIKLGKIIDINLFINDLKNKGIEPIFLDKFVPFDQKGQTCKLVAGIAVQNYLYASKFNSIKPWPLHKKHRTFDYSLRQRAKEVIDSKVGEVYGTEQVKKVFEYNGFEVSPFRMDHEVIYTKLIRESLKNLCPVIVFLDVIPRREEIQNNGSPALLNGRFEHAAVIVGIYKENDKYRVIYSQWGGFYDCSVTDLFKSTSQLKTDKNSEDYKKFNPIPFVLPKSVWISNQQVKDTLEIFYGDMPIRKFLFSMLHTFFSSRIRGDAMRNRIANPPMGLEGSLANTIIIITGDSMSKDFLFGYENFLVRNEPSSFVDATENFSEGSFNTL